MKPLIRRLTWALAVMSILISACGQQSIATSSPLYVLVNDGGNLSVQVLDQSDFHVAGKIDLQSVGTTPPSGAVAAAPGGAVLVTYTGVVVDRQSKLTPNTEACSLSTSQCTTVWSGWGSATARSLGDSSIAVPAWDFNDVTSGKVAFFGGSGLSLRRQVALARSMPGPVTISQDGRYLYWLTFPPRNSGQAVEQELVRVVATTGQIDATVRFGKRLPHSVTTDAEGDVIVSMLYDVAPVPPSGPGQQPVPGVPGSTLEVFKPDLTPLRTIRTAKGPSEIAVVGTSVLVAAAGDFPPGSVYVYPLAGSAQPATIPLPSDWILTGLQALRLANGTDVGIIVLNRAGGNSYRLGVVDPSTGTARWHEFSGEALGSVSA